MSAKVIADSITPAGHRVTTFEVVMHRFVLAEFNTHRVFSRNSASSRAIPLAKQISRIRQNPALPVKWASEQKGMQGGDEIHHADEARSLWYGAIASAVAWATDLGEMSLHKSVVNRLLEPFMWHTVVVTSTAWDNFFGLRCNPMAQPEIRVAAEAMEAAYVNSTPQVVYPGQWHLPYIQDDERADMPVETQVKVSAARCARVSYLTQNGVRDFEQDVQLYERLISADPMHASPLEHVARPASTNQHTVNIAEPDDEPMWVRLPLYGNLLGWRQHRFDVESLRRYQAYA